MKDKIFNETKRKMDKVLEAMARDLARVRTGRASVALLEGIKVECLRHHHAPAPGGFPGGAGEPGCSPCSPGTPPVLGDIEKAILKSDLGLNPVNDGKIIRLPIPALTTERRKELVEDGEKNGGRGQGGPAQRPPGSQRGSQRDEEGQDISEDDAHRGQDEVQKITDEYIKKVEAQAAEKEKEIMSF